MNQAGHEDMPVDDDVSVERSYVDWPDGTEISSVEQLAALLERDVDDIDDWIHGALAEDPGDVQVTDESIAFVTLGGRVTMWNLAFPFTKDQFDAYLVECDDRTTIAKCLMSIPTEEEWRAAGEPTIVPELADLCCASTDEFVSALGYRWEPIDLDWMGDFSEPVVYLRWNGRHIVGIDDCNLHVWSPGNPDAVPDEVRIRATRSALRTSGTSPSTGEAPRWIRWFASCRRTSSCGRKADLPLVQHRRGCWPRSRRGPGSTAREETLNSGPTTRMSPTAAEPARHGRLSQAPFESARAGKIRPVVTDAELRWALTYDGYARFAHSPEALLEVLRPAMAEHAATKQIPEWCGVDFLRAWAFYRQREHHHVGHGPIAEDFYDVLEAIRRHPKAKKRDLPPSPPLRLPGDWSAHLAATLEAPYWSELMDFVASERQAHEVFPPEEQTFRALE